MSAPVEGPRTREKLGLLGSLYFSQGLPYGFFTQALPVLLRTQGLSLPAIGAANMLALPWMLKFLWAPLVDRTPSGAWGLGRRRARILSLQALTVLSVVGLSMADPGRSLWVVMAGTLAEGAAWCEAPLGVLPGAGGEHPLFGTHNRLLSVA